MPRKKLVPLYGVELVALFDYKTNKPLGYFQAVASAGLERSVEMTTMSGGNAAGALDAEPGAPENSFSATLRELPDFLLETVEGAKKTVGNAEASGYVDSELTDTKGTSLSSKITAVAVKSTSKNNLPFGEIIFTATGTNKVKVQVLGALAGGINGFASEDCTVIEELTLSGGTVDLEDLGITLTLAADATLTEGDVALVKVRPVNNGYSELKVGSSDGIRYFGVLIVWPKASDGSIKFCKIHKVAAGGVPISAGERAYSEISISGTPLVDTCQNGEVYTFCRLHPAEGC